MYVHMQTRPPEQQRRNHRDLIHTHDCVKFTRIVLLCCCVGEVGGSGEDERAGESQVPFMCSLCSKSNKMNFYIIIKTFI